MISSGRAKGTNACRSPRPCPAVDRAAARERACAEINRKYGKKTIQLGSEFAGGAAGIWGYCSGSANPVNALDAGGVPSGKLMEIYGESGTYRTTIALQIAARVQKAGGVVYYIDAEHTLEPQYARSVGLDIDRTYFTDSNCLDLVMDVIKIMIRSGGVDFVVVDTVAALEPSEKIAASREYRWIGSRALPATLLNKAAIVLKLLARRHNCSILFLNQERTRPVTHEPYSPGGHALKSYILFQIRLTTICKIAGKGGKHIGSDVLATVMDSSMSSPGESMEMRVLYGKGIDYVAELVDAAEKLYVLNVREGKYYLYGYKNKYVEGRSAAIETVRKNAAMRLELQNLVGMALAIQDKCPDNFPGGPTGVCQNAALRIFSGLRSGPSLQRIP